MDVDDGILFEYESIEPIREEDAYNNFRVHLRAKYGKIDTPMKIDVTTGDAITPAAVQYDFPMLFEDKTVPVMAYTLETVLAEKYETIIRRNISTTRARVFMIFTRCIEAGNQRFALMFSELLCYIQRKSENPLKISRIGKTF